jgi:hypothetical protein
MSARKLSMLTSTTFHGPELESSALVVDASGAAATDEDEDDEEGGGSTGGGGVRFEQPAQAMHSARMGARVIRECIPSTADGSGIDRRKPNRRDRRRSLWPLELEFGDVVGPGVLASDHQVRHRGKTRVSPRRRPADTQHRGPASHTRRPRK